MGSEKSLLSLAVYEACYKSYDRFTLNVLDPKFMAHTIGPMSRMFTANQLNIIRQVELDRRTDEEYQNVKPAPIYVQESVPGYRRKEQLRHYVRGYNDALC